MSDATMGSAPAAGRDLSNDTHPATIPVFVLLLVCGIGYAVYGLLSDINNTGQSPLAIGAFVLLGLALLIALGFEFVNGFHDTANAVATVIYTHSPAAAGRGGLVGLLELPRRAGLHRRGRLQHHHAAAGRADPAGRQRRRLSR